MEDAGAGTREGDGATLVAAGPRSLSPKHRLLVAGAALASPRATLAYHHLESHSPQPGSRSPTVEEVVELHVVVQVV